MPIAPLVGAFRIPATAAGVEAKAYEVKWGLRLCAFLPAGSQELCSKTEHALEALIKLKVRAARRGTAAYICDCLRWQRWQRSCATHMLTHMPICAHPRP